MKRALPLLLLGLSACAAPGELALELGTGEIAFEPIEGEPTLPLVAGPQGGHHVWVSVVVVGASSERAELLVDVVPVDGPEPPRRAPVRVQLEASEGGDAEIVGWPAELADPGCMVGRRAIVRATLTDEDGAVGVDERAIVIGAGTSPPDC